MRKIAPVLLSIPLMAFSQIARFDTLNLNSYVNLETAITGSFNPPIATGQVRYPCTTNAAGKDFYTNFYDVSVCICPCPSGAIGSPRPFYLSKKPLGQMDFNQALPLGDTLLFTKIDTVRNAAFSGGCALPFIVKPRYVTPNPFVVSTGNHRFALVMVTPIIKNVECLDVSPPNIYRWTEDHLVGYGVRWYLSPNPHPYFPDLINTGIVTGSHKNPLPVIDQGTISARSEVYSLLGRKIIGANQSSHRSDHFCRGVYIVKNTEKLRLMIR
jgi:hypothetical protein